MGVRSRVLGILVKSFKDTCRNSKWNFCINWSRDLHSQDTWKNYNLDEIKF